MDKLNELVVITKNKKNELIVADFEKAKEKIIEELKTYTPFIVQNKSDYLAVKNARAELNTYARNINDNKISWVKDVTSEVENQVKEICTLIKDKAQEFDNEAKKYESNTLNKEVKLKNKYQVNINIINEEELNTIKKLLDSKKITYTIKEF